MTEAEEATNNNKKPNDEDTLNEGNTHKQDIANKEQFKGKKDQD